MTCTRCGSAGDDDAIFCGSCGWRLTAQAANGAGAPAAPAAARVTATPPRPPQQAPPRGYGTAGGSAGTPPQQAPPTARRTAGGSTPSAIGVGVFVSLLGAISLIAAIVLQFAKVTMDGASLNASQANGICQSTLGQLGQAFSSGFGNSTPTDVCHQAATIEDWKGITVWLAIVAILIGMGLIVRGASEMSGRPAGQRTRPGTGTAQQSAAAKLAAAERAEANAARLRAQAAQLTSAQMTSAQMTSAQATPPPMTPGATQPGPPGTMR